MSMMDTYLWEHVFRFITDRKTLYQCLFVSKFWNQLATDRIDTLIEDYYSLVDTLETCSQTPLDPLSMEDLDLLREWAKVDVPQELWEHLMIIQRRAQSYCLVEGQETCIIYKDCQFRRRSSPEDRAEHEKHGYPTGAIVASRHFVLTPWITLCDHGVYLTDSEGVYFVVVSVYVIQSLNESKKLSLNQIK